MIGARSGVNHARLRQRQRLRRQGALLAQHPIGANVVIAALFAAAFRIAWRGALHAAPLSDEASDRKELGLVLLAPSILLVMQVIFLVLTGMAAERVYPPRAMDEGDDARFEVATPRREVLLRLYVIATLNGWNSYHGRGHATGARAGRRAASLEMLRPGTLRIDP